jgi:glutamine synthetase type III
MQIQSSLDWNDVQSELRRQIGQLPYNPDLWKMLNNLDYMVTDLSKAEVEARRYHKLEYTKPKVDAINQAIDHLEKLLLIAHLMR